MKPSEKKAIKYVKDKKVFRLLKDSKYELYGVEADSGTYEVRFDIDKELYRCNCKNIRITDCAHILAVIIMRENDVSNNTGTMRTF